MQDNGAELEKLELAERLSNAARVVKLVDALPQTAVGRQVGDHLLRTDAAIGANHTSIAESCNDFPCKLQITPEELRESNHWLRLLNKAKTLPDERLADIVDRSNRLRARLIKVAIKAKEKTI